MLYSTLVRSKKELHKYYKYLSYSRTQELMTKCAVYDVHEGKALWRKHHKSYIVIFFLHHGKLQDCTFCFRIYHSLVCLRECLMSSFSWSGVHGKIFQWAFKGIEKRIPLQCFLVFFFRGLGRRNAIRNPRKIEMEECDVSIFSNIIFFHVVAIVECLRQIIASHYFFKIAIIIQMARYTHHQAKKNTLQNTYLQSCPEIMLKISRLVPGIVTWRKTCFSQQDTMKMEKLHSCN